MIVDIDQENKPNYYAIIPATIRYDERLKANEKLMYGEITALSNKSGHCTARNSYFAKLYNVHKNTISTWVNKLKELGYITVELILNEQKQVVKRLIGINQKIDRGLNQKIDTSQLKAEVLHNTTRGNNINNNNKAIELPFHTDSFAKAWSEWKEYKSIEFRFKYKSSLSESKGLTELKNMSGDNEEEAIRLIDNAIAKGWSGIHASKDKLKQPTITSPNQPLFIYKINGERKKHSDQKRWQRDKDCFEQVDCYEEIEIRK